MDGLGTLSPRLRSSAVLDGMRANTVVHESEQIWNAVNDDIVDPLVISANPSVYPVVSIQHYGTASVLDQDNGARDIYAARIGVTARERTQTGCRPLLFPRLDLFLAYVGMSRLLWTRVTEILRKKAIKDIERRAIAPFGMKVIHQAFQRHSQQRIRDLRNLVLESCGDFSHAV